MQLSEWRPRTYSPDKIVMMERLLLRAKGKQALTTEEIEDACLDLMGEWTGAGGPDVGEIRKRVYKQRQEDQTGKRDPTAHNPDLRLGGHDGHGNQFMNREQLQAEWQRLKRDFPHAWDEPREDDSLHFQADRIYRKAIETGLSRKF